ncbi:MAG: DUF4876 domain-containing protein [Bacteroidota bacterium]
MKRIPFILAALFLLSSCMKEPDFHTFDIQIHFNFGPEARPQDRAQGLVKLNNLQKSYTLTALTDSLGNVGFPDAEPGFYSVQLIHSFSSPDGIITYHANAYKNITVMDQCMDTAEVAISESNVLVIKEYYYSACLTPAENQYSADQFVEIYNNSADTAYLDGISLIEHESYGLEPYYFSWITDSIVCRMIWTIPGEGRDYPLAPGHGAVLARDAFDHRSDPLGNPLCPVDLAHADFEFFVYTASGDDIDGPYSPNLIEDLFTFRGSDIIFHTRGGSAIALVKIPGNDEERKDFIAHNLVQREAVVSTRYYGKIPNDWVLDAVEVVFDEAHAVYKRFPVELDAGYTYNPAGAKSGTCLRRKVAEVIDGRVVYQDTNNSCEDFLTGVIPKPWIYEE